MLYLPGIVHGHYDVAKAAGVDELPSDADAPAPHAATEEKIKVGTAIVVPIEKVAELLEDSMIIDSEVRNAPRGPASFEADLASECHASRYEICNADAPSLPPSYASRAYAAADQGATFSDGES